MSSCKLKMSFACSSLFLILLASNLSHAQKPQFACSVDVTHPCSAAGNGGCDLVGAPGWPDCSNLINPDPVGTFRSALFQFVPGNNGISILPDEVDCGTETVCRPEDPEFDGEYVCVPTANVGNFVVTEVIASGTEDCFPDLPPISWPPF